MARFTISGEQFELDRDDVERRLRDLLPDPVYLHYVIVEGRRYPPKQVLSCATGLDRADFTTHQARRILKRLGFVAARSNPARVAGTEPATEHREGSGHSPQAEALRPYVGQWVALAGPTEVLVAADSPEAVLGWLAQHERRASYGMFRVPASTAEAEGMAPT